MKYAIELFDIRPLHFLIKPLEDQKIEQVIKTYLEISEYWHGTFTYKVGHDIFKIQLRDIMYLESIDRKIILHLSDGRKEAFYGALKDVYHEQLERFDFLFIHAKYAVNYDYMTTLKYSELILTNGTVLPISQPRRVDVRDAYIAIIEKRRI